MPLPAFFALSFPLNKASCELINKTIDYENGVSPFSLELLIKHLQIRQIMQKHNLTDRME